MKFGHKKQSVSKEQPSIQTAPAKVAATPSETFMDHLKQIAQETSEEFEVFTQASNAMLDGEISFKQDEEKDVQNIDDQAAVLMQAQNAIDNGAFEAQGPEEKQELKEEEPFTPKKEDQLLLDQARDIVEAVNALDLASLKEDHHRKHLEKDLKEPGEYNPESVIDEKIKEEQKEQAEDALKDEIVHAL